MLKEAGITIGKKLTEQAIKQLSLEVIKKINRAVGFRLVTKFGQTGVVNLGKAVPLIGGVVGGAFDGTTTFTIGKVAKNVFVGETAPKDDPTQDQDETDVFEDLSQLLFPQEDEPGRGNREEHRRR